MHEIAVAPCRDCMGRLGIVKLGNADLLSVKQTNGTAPY